MQVKLYINIFESSRSDQMSEANAIEAIFTYTRAEGSSRLRQQGVKKFNIIPFALFIIIFLQTYAQYHTYSS